MTRILKGLDRNEEKSVSKIGKALKFLIDELPLEFSSVNIKSAADIMQDILKSILEKSYNRPEDIEIEFYLQLYQSFISPTLDYGIQNTIEEWIRKLLNMPGLKFAVEYDINLTERIIFLQMLIQLSNSFSNARK